MSRTAGRPTLQVLADDLGVSRATVSNAYNRPDQLSPALRRRVLARAAELGFGGPDPVARGLRRGRVGAVGVLVDEGLSYAFSDPVAVLALDGLARELQADGTGLLLHPAVLGATDVRAVQAAAVDAWVLLSLPGAHPAVDAALAQGRPLVVLDQPPVPGAPVVTVDDRAGARAVAEHLLALGHHRLAVLTPPLAPGAAGRPADLARQAAATNTVMSQRLRAVAGAVARAGGRWEDVPVVECGANDEPSGAAGAGLLLARSPRPTAVLALSDQLALGALRAAREAGTAVPEQLSVTGFDDAPPAAGAGLTTVAQPLREKGALVGRLVRALLAGEEVESPPPLPVSLLVRRSTAPPAAG